MKVKELTSISANDAHKLTKEGAVLVDVRGDYKDVLKLYDVEQTIFSSLGELPQKMHELPKDKTLIIACTAGMKSKRATQFLMDNGFVNVLNLAGGIMEWERKGMPVKKGERQSWSDMLVNMFKKKESKN